MGCDIHFYVEKRTDCGWVNVPDAESRVENPWYDRTKPTSDFNTPYEWFSDRDYTLFGLLAGVRHPDPENPPIAPDRGAPSDASDFVSGTHIAWGLDAHSASWASIEELERVGASPRWKHPEIAGLRIGPGNHWRATVARMREIAGDDPTSVRAVFWFDN